ncbi:nucleotide-sugar transporter-domain-containing protein [Syncephalis pseudoplumigaleata]|uniref:Nucleotide-sugar transporter-domain-containing protein n=1 Tax=Syncephalis pseudoplumigaleata TaxID=1712513 RepID=A0A4P9Z7B8_9FUNG|nr:nucleotide-sugar transporter-domain-containing protein [Syncephalis pseudoplumigaleata]|eukprot:RKP28092.1 nucleotide-sugar transporter-domain-containing protein [Syncephalis pseudoplumigaleata]
MRYSRTVRTPGQPVYIASTAVVLAEVVKLLACLAILYAQSSSWAACWRRLQRDIAHRPRDLLLMAVPSALYAVQNNLLYVALSNLEAASFQVTYQLKILSTAVFSVILLGKRVHRLQWFSLGMLMLGVALVQLQTSSSSSSTATTTADADADAHSEAVPGQSALVGFSAVMTACLLSGFAGCYFERVLKTTDTSMWIRNIQLGMSGLLFSLLVMLVEDGGTIMDHGMLYGYNALTWSVLVNQALGGLLVAIVVKYADNILKGFATSISIVLSGMISYLLFGFQPNQLFMLGTTVVIVATVLYGRTDGKTGATKPWLAEHAHPIGKVPAAPFYDSRTSIHDELHLLRDSIDPKYAQLLTRRNEYHM